MSLLELVAEKLAAHPGESFVFAGRDPLPPDAPGFEAYRDAVVAEMTRRLGAKLQSLRTPPPPGAITLKSWQYGLTDATDDEAAARSFHDGVFLRLQQFRDGWLSSERWRESLDAFDRPDRWLALARAREAEGWLVEANACFAAARWLDPTVEPAIAELTAARDPRLPRRFLDQPLADYPARPFADRHWRAWDMKNYGRLDLPTLLRWECDPNFSIRARIYRSLGQQPHPAAIQALREGTSDPHPFARAQAVRSLGWCADPSSVDHLRRLASDDPHPEVRRTAAKSAERITAFWLYYGEWTAIARDRRRCLAAAQALADRGLPIAAFEVTVRFGNAGTGDDPAIDALSDALEAHVPARGFAEREQSYGHWFAEAREIERAGAPDMSFEAAVAEADAPGAAGFAARRTLRRLGRGTLEQRRAPL